MGCTTACAGLLSEHPLRSANRHRGARAGRARRLGHGMPAWRVRCAWRVRPAAVSGYASQAVPHTQHSAPTGRRARLRPRRATADRTRAVPIDGREGPHEHRPWCAAHLHAPRLPPTPQPAALCPSRASTRLGCLRRDGTDGAHRRGSSSDASCDHVSVAAHRETVASSLYQLALGTTVKCTAVLHGTVKVCYSCVTDG